MDNDRTDENRNDENRTDENLTNSEMNEAGMSAPKPEPRPTPAPRPGPTPLEWGLQRLNELGDTLEAARRDIDSFFPPEFKEHSRVAQREVWLALRALIDARLEAIERGGRPQPPAPKPPSSGRVDIG